MCLSSRSPGSNGVRPTGARVSSRNRPRNAPRRTGTCRNGTGTRRWPCRRRNGTGMRPRSGRRTGTGAEQGQARAARHPALVEPPGSPEDARSAPVGRGPIRRRDLRNRGRPSQPQAWDRSDRDRQNRDRHSQEGQAGDRNGTGTRRRSGHRSGTGKRRSHAPLVNGAEHRSMGLGNMGQAHASGSELGQGAGRGTGTRRSRSRPGFP